MTKILLHSCCGPCSIAILDKFAKEQQDIISYFFNPNIHPFTEHKARKNAWLELMQQTQTEHILDASYPLEDWLKQVAQEYEDRCGFCYAIRLKAAAKVAKENSCTAFTTSLLISPYQKHDIIKEIGETIGKIEGIPFYYEDFRPLFKPGQQMAREVNLYMQKYCGCIYSEKERYCKK